MKLPVTLSEISDSTSQVAAGLRSNATVGCEVAAGCGEGEMGVLKSAGVSGNVADGVTEAGIVALSWLTGAQAATRNSDTHTSQASFFNLTPGCLYTFGRKCRDTASCMSCCTICGA